MSTQKRIFAAVLGILMLSALAVPVLAYSTPYTAPHIAPATSVIPPAYAISYATATPEGSSLYERAVYGGEVRPDGTLYMESASGALYASSYPIDSYHQNGAKSTNLIGDPGNTMDLAVKFEQLPSINDYLTIDPTTGAATALDQSIVGVVGFVLDVHSTKNHYQDTESDFDLLYSIMAFDNAFLGTNGIIIEFDGDRLGVANFTQCPRRLWFVNLDMGATAEFHRYTFTMDLESTADLKTCIYMDGVALPMTKNINGTEYPTYADFGSFVSGSTAHIGSFMSGDWVSIQACARTTTGGSAKVYLDQTNIYPRPLTPTAGGFVGTFEEDASYSSELVIPKTYTKAIGVYHDLLPFAAEYYGLDNPFWVAFENALEKAQKYIDYGEQANLNYISGNVSGYTTPNANKNLSWFTGRMTYLSIGASVTISGLAATVYGTKEVIPAGTPILQAADKLHIAFAANDVDESLAWTNGSVILTKPGTCFGDYSAFGDSSYMYATSGEWSAMLFRPAGVPGYYQLVSRRIYYNNTPEFDTMPIPEGGFIFAWYGTADNALTTPYSSVLFGARNVRAVYAMGLVSGDYVRLNNVTFNADGSANLDTTGEWISYGDPRLVAGGGTLEPNYLQRLNNGEGASGNDRFIDFQTNSTLEMVEAPAGDTVGFTGAVSGDGSFTVSVDDRGAGACTSDYSTQIASGATVTLTATGENFRFWTNAVTGKSISSNPVLTFRTAQSAVSLVAVFADETAEETTSPVYFKDGKTGKILKTMHVPMGYVLQETDYPETSCIGYHLVRWTVRAGSPVKSTKIITSVYERHDLLPKNTLTIIRGERTTRIERSFGSLVSVDCDSPYFTCWKLNGVTISLDPTILFAMPQGSCVLEEVIYEAAPNVVTANVGIIKEEQIIYYTMSRSARVGITILETGVLMTRKATAEDLVLNSGVASVSKGTSSAADEFGVVGFRKDATGKTGTWLVRGYVTYQNFQDEIVTAYTDVTSIVID